MIQVSALLFLIGMVMLFAVFVIWDDARRVARALFVLAIIHMIPLPLAAWLAIFGALTGR